MTFSSSLPHSPRPRTCSFQRDVNVRFRQSKPDCWQPLEVVVKKYGHGKGLASSGASFLFVRRTRLGKFVKDLWDNPFFWLSFAVMIVIRMFL
jgi:hypothetical protein